MVKLSKSPKPFADELEIPPAPPRLHPLEKPPEPPVPPSRKTPPLFIKIDKYVEIVKNIQNLKSYSLSLRDALEAIAEIETELKTGLAVTQQALDKFNTIIAMLDAKLLRIQGLDIGSGEGKSEEMDEMDGMDEHIKRLYSQVEKIRQDIKTI